MAEAAIQQEENPQDDKREGKQNDELAIVSYWLGEIERATKTFKEWNDRCDKITKRYRDERDAAKRGVRKFNILWSNIQTMKPAVYAKPPKPVIERRFLERNDVERTAGMLLERASMVEMETSNFDEVIGGKQGAVLDYLLAGRGQVRLRYEAEIDEGDESSVEDNPEQEEDEKEEQSETKLPAVTSEHLAIDFIHRNDFLHDPARTWDEVRWVGFRSWMTRREVKAKNWGDNIADRLEYKDMNADNRDRDGQDRRPVEKRAELWQIWDKNRRRVWVISPSLVDMVIHQEDDPLKLKNFWPCPKPLYATMTPDTLIPVPDYAEYQDQADELDELSERIARLTQAIKACGVYDASQPEIASIFQTTTDNKLIASENWGTFKERGGVNGSMELLDIKMMAETLQILEEEFDKKLSRLYEITGIADIIRGDSDPDETYGAQKIKGHFATLRLKDRQKDVANFCRDILRIMVELISEHFSPETLAVMTGLADTNLLQQGLQQPQQPQQPAPQGPPGAQAPQAPPGAPQQPVPPQLSNDQSQQLQQIPLFQQALQLIKDSRLRTFRIDIENMSTIEMDIEQDKESATELLKGIGEFCTGVLPVGQKVPQLMPLFGEMILHAVRKFRSGRELESTLEQTVDQLEGLAKQAAVNPPPDPEMAKVQQSAEESKQKMAMEASSQQNDQQMERERFQFEQLQHQDDLQLQREKFQQEIALEREKFEHEKTLKVHELHHNAAMDQQELHHSMAMKEVDREHETQLAREQMDQSGDLEEKKIASNEKIAKNKPAPKK